MISLALDDGSANKIEGKNVKLFINVDKRSAKNVDQFCFLCL